MVAHALQHQSVSDLPGEHGGVVVFQLQNPSHNSGSGHFGLRTTDQARSDASRLIVPEETKLISIRGVNQWGGGEYTNFQIDELNY